nr:putative methyltransferase [Erysiphe necator associated abispo virus 3]
MQRYNKQAQKIQTPPVSGGGSGASAPRKPHRNTPLCRTSQYQPPGSDIVGLSSKNQPSKVVWELDYGLTDKQFENLSKRFPGIAFVQTGIDCHDHPIAHASYRVVWENVLKKLQPGWKVADVAGNPQHNEIFNKKQKNRNSPITIDTFCKVLSTKDSIRAKTRWGPPERDGAVRWEEMTLYDMYRNDENRSRFAQYDAFLINHSIYYYTKAEINRLLNLNKGAVLYATLHKLEGQNGTINCGEQSYEKDLVTGEVVQVNVETGEKYKHPDPMPWFRHFAYADSHGAIAWTINKGCDDTYVLTITSTEPRLVEACDWAGGNVIHSDGVETIIVNGCGSADPPPAYAVEEVKLRTHDILSDHFENKEITVKITHPELYDSLKAFMINKPRTHRTLQDLTAKAHREVGNNTLMGANRRVKITPKALTQHIFAAWMAGTGHEAEMFSASLSSSSYSSAVNRNLSGKTLTMASGNMAKQLARYTLAASSVIRAKDPAHSVLEQLDELL